MKSHTHTQSGAALIIFLTILILGITAILLSELNTRNDLMLEDQEQTRRALIQAKEALIGFAATFSDRSSGRYGFLPCPDTNTASGLEEGVAHGSCPPNIPPSTIPAGTNANRSSLGRLPWRTLGLPALRDGAGECLWYAVSGPYKGVSSTTAVTNMLNEDTNGLFDVFISDDLHNPSALTGTQPQDRAVAIIIAPGKILSDEYKHNDQDRSIEKGAELCGGNYTPSNYLDIDKDVDEQKKIIGSEISNAEFSIEQDTLNKFITAQDNLSLINDRIVYITREELWGAIRKRRDFMIKMQDLTRRAASCVANYANSSTDRRLPWAAPVDLAADYRDDTAYTDQNLVLSGRLPNDIKKSSGSNDFLITNCDSTIMTPELLTLWQNWKDHLFYAVANAHQPNASTTTPVCDNSDILSENDCLQVNNNNYAAVVMFSNGPLPVVGSPAKEQLRDNKGDITNYLEGLNAIVNTDGKGTYQQWNLSNDINNPDNINDILYCIRDSDLAVMLCPCTPAMKAIHSWCP